MNKIVRLLCLAAVSACCVLAWSDAAAVCSTAVRYLGHGNNSGFDADPGCDINNSTSCAGQDFMIANQADWDSLWSRHISNMCELNTTCDCYNDENCPCCLPWSIEDHPAPSVNFNKERVLASFLGRRRTTGFSTQISCVEYSTTINGLHPNAVVTVHDRQPGSQCIVQPLLTNYWHFVAAPKTTGGIMQQSQPFVFEHELEVYSCGDNCQVCPPGGNGGIGPPCCP
jgi:hypothetical protein